MTKDDIDDNLKFEQSDELYDNSLDFSPAVPKKSKSKREGGNVEKRIKKKKKPSKLECPGYCDECHKEHRITKEGEKKDYPCDLCDKSYICVKTLRKHKKFHAGKFKCDICGKSLTCKSVLESHINNQHKGPYPCEICGKLYNNINALSKHKVFHVKSINKTEEILKCSVCEKEFTGKRRHYYLRAHMICHSSDKPHTCDICGTSFSRPSSLYVHKKTHNEEIFSCDICGKTLKTSQTLALHKLTHADITFNCTMCQKTFSSKPGLKRHIKTHTGIGLYHCELCEKSFDLKDKLTRHERTHSGVKPFYCEACNMSFYSKGELTKHKKLSIRHADNMKKMGGGDDEVLDQLKDENAD